MGRPAGHGAGPRQPLAPVDDETRARVRALCEALGVKPARVALKVSPEVLDELRSGGRVKPDTLARVKARLDALDVERAKIL